MRAVIEPSTLLLYQVQTTFWDGRVENSHRFRAEVPVISDGTNENAETVGLQSFDATNLFVTSLSVSLVFDQDKRPYVLIEGTRLHDQDAVVIVVNPRVWTTKLVVSSNYCRRGNPVNTRNRRKHKVLSNDFESL